MSRDPLAPVPFSQQVPDAVRNQVEIFTSAYSNIIVFVSVASCHLEDVAERENERMRNVD
jgi:hypothetical protein